MGSTGAASASGIAPSSGVRRPTHHPHRSLNLILLEPGEVGTGGEAHLDGPRAAHLRNVLKAAPGQSVRVGVLDGPLGLATVRSIATESVVLTCTLDPGAPPRPRVDLLLALPRPKVMRRLWAQLSALGVSRIILTNAERVERPYFDSHVIEPDCYRPLLVEGLQQAKDTALPKVSVHRRLKGLIEDELDGLVGEGLRLVADPAGSRSVRDATNGHPGGGSPARVLLAIGPEGGWNAFELQLFEAHGFHRVSSGPRTLRSDTACLALLALVHDAISESG